MIKYPFKKIPSGINILQYSLCCNTKKLKSKDLNLVVFRGEPGELIYFKNPEQDPHNSAFTSSFKGH